ncbi:endonuclease/exonuclease/phosphatase family protein [Nocardioides sp. NPDC058538]|uniref:endonuclease/exonuclease/phosphatase family protein n=1 Tax=Nocardioides sp. NPDC058538 TaxID=3346542 RepID=UPI0036682A2A
MRIGTWNLENLFHPDVASGAPSGMEEYDAKLDALAATIKDLDPSVLAVQEVGDPEALADLVGRLGGAWHTELAEPDGRGIRNGIIATAALSDVEQFADFPDILAPIQVQDDGTTIDAVGRPGLRARVKIGKVEVDVVSVHLKSKLLSFPGGRFNSKDEGERARYGVYALARRAAEAAAVRAGVDRLLDGDGEKRAVVIAGDLNDEPQAATTQILLGPGGSEIGTPGYDRPDKGDAMRLWNVAPLIPEEERFSRIYRGRRELIDHLMVSRALTGRIKGVTTGSVKIASVTDDPRARKDAAGSDHRPVVATFDI